MCYLQSGPGTSAIVVLLALIPVPQYPVCAEIPHLIPVCVLLVTEAHRKGSGSVVDGKEKVRQAGSKRKTDKVREEQLCSFSCQAQPFLRIRRKLEHEG